MKPITINRKTDISRLLRKMIRGSVGANNSCPILLVPGNFPPVIHGEGWHYRNKRGDRIWHPGAYRRAWGKPIYVSSTRRVEVGVGWLFDHLTLEKVRMHTLRAYL